MGTLVQLAVGIFGFDWTVRLSRLIFAMAVLTAYWPFCYAMAWLWGLPPDFHHVFAWCGVGFLSLLMLFTWLREWLRGY